MRNTLSAIAVSAKQRRLYTTSIYVNYFKVTTAIKTSIFQAVTTHYHYFYKLSEVFRNVVPNVG